MKKILSLLFAALLCAALVLPANAADNTAFVYDEANLLTDREAQDLSRRLAQISEEYEAQVVIFTVRGTNGLSVERFANQLYDSAPFGYGENRDGVLLVIDMQSRKFWILGNGFASKAISNDIIEDITDAITPELKDGQYSDAFHTFASECEYYLNGYIHGFPFDVGENLVIALVAGLVIALIVVLAMKSQLKSVRRQSQANAYMVPGSLNLTQRGDYFMYSTLTRTAKPKNNSSSSGGGGGGGRSGGGGSF